MPITLTVTSAGGGLYCLLIRRIEGIAIATRISTGTTVQMTSITVLWLVREGIGLAPRRNLTIVSPSRISTKTLIAAHMMSSGPLWKAAASWPTSVTWSWMPLRPSGAPMPRTGAAYSIAGAGAATGAAAGAAAGAASGAGAVATGVAAACGAAAGGVCAPSDAGVNPIAVRASAQPINFIVIRPLWRCHEPPRLAGCESGGLIGPTFPSLKHPFRAGCAMVAAPPRLAYSGPEPREAQA